MATTQTDAPSTTDATPLAGLYLVKFVLGNEGMPGAPLLHVQALVDAPTGAISGHAQITQATSPPLDIQINNVTGQIRSLGFQTPAVRVVTLSGSYPSPIKTQPLELGFSATIVLDQNGWFGHGSFEYGGERVDNVPVRPED